ncbi:hypothetical protein [Vibrio sp. Hal054]|uniref:hypothetical protein n=1 Tax=Vibrio sp. Hal054 TaxID=3035158 RepID=UPI00301E1C52
MKLNRMIMLVALSISMKAVANDPAVDGYIISTDSQSPELAQQVNWYKNVLEKECGSAIGISTIESEGFANVTDALLVARPKQHDDGRGQTLYEYVQAKVEKTAECSNEGRPFELLLLDSYLIQNYSNYHKYLSVRDKINKEEVPNLSELVEVLYSYAR